MSAVESVPFGDVSDCESSPLPRPAKALLSRADTASVVTRSSTATSNRNLVKQRSAPLPPSPPTLPLTKPSFVVRGSPLLPHSNSTPSSFPDRSTTPPPAATPPSAFSKTETLLIFDWDDTLCPSSWLSARNLTLEDRSVVPTELKPLLAKMADFTRQTLELAAELGTVIIVTNAEHGWIELSCKKFLADLYVHLCKYRHLSARTRYESENINCPFTWKQLAFREEICSHYTGEGVRRNVVSLGDSVHERLAIISVMRDGLVGGPAVRTKSVKFLERPTLEQLMLEHELILKVLREVVQFDDDLDLCIKPTS